MNCRYTGTRDQVTELPYPKPYVGVKGYTSMTETSVTETSVTERSFSVLLQ